MNRGLLLDTHVLIWALSLPGRIPQDVRRDISRSEVYVSAASIWEIAIKFVAGKIEQDPAIVLREVEIAGFDLLPVSGVHAARTADLNNLGTKDPFDRVLLAQALHESMTLITNDAALHRYAPTVRVI
ncbi:MAG: type II toxin-antitoxin system VapC family toxin [Burkholderiales bacterium]